MGRKIEDKSVFQSLKNLFKKKTGLPGGIAFIDYEHWYIALEKMYDKKPDIHIWLHDVQKICDLKEVIFFAKNIILVFICVPPSHHSEKIISDFMKSVCIITVKEGKYSLE